MCSSDLGPHITNQTQYIGFSGNNDTLIGKISARFNPNNGVVQSGITLESSGADYAEYLEKIYPQEVIKKGDVVGVFNGKITKNTRDAQKVMVVSSMPLVIGNWKGKKRDDLYQPIAFVGQVPVRVRGPVHAGDVIIPSGRNDGTATAVHPDQLSIEQAAAIIGTAWGSSETDHNDLKTITTVTVAITPLDSPISLFKKLKAEQSRLKEENQALKEGLEELRKEFDMLRHAVLPKRT